MKISKVLGLGVAALVIVIIAAGIYLWSSLDSIVEAAIEKHGSAVTQTRVEVAGVKLELTSGKGSIQGITVDSPAGYTRPQVFTLDNIAVAIDTKTVTNDVVVIDEILIQAPQIFYEINDKGVANVDVLKNNVSKSTAGSSKEAAKSEGEGKDVKLIIRRLVIDKTEADARVAALGNKDISVNLPKIVMTNIGKKKGGASPAEIAEQVTSVLIKKVSKAVADQGMQQYLGKSADEAKAQLQEKADKAIGDKLGDDLKGLFSK